MQDRIRKIGRWIWYNKERMLLVVMVAFLMYRVYQVVYPPPPPAEVPLVPPRTELPSADMAPPGVLPPQPGPPPPMAIPAPVEISARNPFWLYGQQSGRDTDGDDAEEVQIDLLRIREVNGALRAQLRTATTTQWYNEGDSFEEYQLLSIDPEAGTAVVYVERAGRRITLSLQ